MNKTIKLVITVLLSVCFTCGLFLIIGAILINNEILFVNSTSNEPYTTESDLANNEEYDEFYNNEPEDYEFLYNTDPDTNYFEEESDWDYLEQIPDGNEEIKTFANDTEEAFQSFFTTFQSFETSVNKKDYDGAIVQMGELNTSANVLLNKVQLYSLSGQYELAREGIINDLKGVNLDLKLHFGPGLPAAKTLEPVAEGLKTDLALLKSKVDMINTSYNDILSEIK